MAEKLTADICIIGGGAGAAEAAIASAAAGASTILIEGGRPAVPMSATALLAAARQAAGMRRAEAFGVGAGGVAVDFACLRAHLEQVVRATGTNTSVERLTGLGVRVIRGTARFQNRRTVAVGDDHIIRARRFIIATGTAPAPPPIPGLDSGSYLTNDTVFDLKALPDHLIVIGGDAAALELAQAFQRLGSVVTVFAAGTPLGGEDPEAVAVVLAQLEREGAVIRGGVNIMRVSYVGSQVSVALDSNGSTETIDGSHLIVTARKAAMAGLDLNAAGIRHTDDGIVVNRKLKTSNGRVYAIGDVVAGQPHAAQVAAQQAALVVSNALLRAPLRAGVAPRVVFTEPELAQAGLTEAEARAARFKIHILRWPYSDNARAQAERTPRGHIKIVAGRRGDILGVTIVGAQAGELIALWNLVIAQRLNVRHVIGMMLPYPTLSQIGQRAALDYFPPPLTRSGVRRIMAWLRVFG